ncbi:hypothetical protein HK103_005626 [Boothiomyces macroporosus]|uniref:Aminotransferase class V domain-containing protein n=1 Tax=Boothiomyces macroporosus TaxID=261099 RepID=A0AAD5Y380_9FUNG|nr:hypothetical protein HK103_005626 [Boothiomyces macroporosus]
MCPLSTAPQNVTNHSFPMKFQDFLKLAESLSEEERIKQLLPILNADIIGQNMVCASPFGVHKIVYADYFASGKSLRMVEEFIREQVLPYYANTHTESSFTGFATGQYKEFARKVIKSSLNANKEDGHESYIIFCGSGSTLGINKLVHLFRIDGDFWLKNASIEKKQESNILKRLSIRKPKSVVHLKKESVINRPVVFISIQEHHSNILPWKQSGNADVVVINEIDGRLDLHELEQTVRIYQSRPLKIGSFSAGSNVTGILNDVEKISILLHSYDAYAIFDYAGVGAYVPVKMNSDHPLGYKDAVVLSPHKMIGGPGSTGILAVRKGLVEELDKIFGPYTPLQVGGGIVDWVDKDVTVFTKSFETLEEAGTPPIIEAIRCGLVFAIKSAIGDELIEKLEVQHFHEGLKKLLENPNIVILGNTCIDRVPVFSLMFKHPNHKSKFLHHHFISAVLNDVFGIQTRSGCACAGPYLEHLLKTSIGDWSAMRAAVLGTNGSHLELLKPGFVRFSLNYFIPQSEIDFILRAVIWVADHAYKLLSLYMCDIHSNRYVIDTSFKRHYSKRDLFKKPFGIQCEYKTLISEQIFQEAEELLELAGKRARTSAEIRADEFRLTKEFENLGFKLENPFIFK